MIPITRRAALSGVAAAPLALAASVGSAPEPEFLSLAQQFVKTHRALKDTESREGDGYRKLRELVGDADRADPAYQAACTALGIGELQERWRSLRRQGWELLRRIAETQVAHPAAIALKLRLAWDAHDIDYGYLDDESLWFLVSRSALDDLDRLGGAIYPEDLLPA